MSFLSIDNLKVDYVTDDGIVHALNGVSLELVQGETLGLVVKPEPAKRQWPNA